MGAISDKQFSVDEFVQAAEQLTQTKGADSALKLGSHELHVVGMFNRSSTLQRTRTQFANALSAAFGKDNKAVIECQSLLTSAKMAKKPLSARTILYMAQMCRNMSEDPAQVKENVTNVAARLKSLRDDAVNVAMAKFERVVDHNAPNYEALKGQLLKEIDKKVGSVKIGGHSLSEQDVALPDAHDVAEKAYWTVRATNPFAFKDFASVVVIRDAVKKLAMEKFDDNVQNDSNNPLGKEFSRYLKLQGVLEKAIEDELGNLPLDRPDEMPSNNEIANRAMARVFERINDDAVGMTPKG